MRLSIIIPVYNVEKYICQCVASLLKQDFDDYEIIIVNDGSTDKSIEIIRRTFNPLPKHTKIIDRPNGGLSCARNTGFKEACGDYVWFIDSDDWIKENILADIVCSLDGCDILCFNSYFSYHDEKSTITIVANNNKESITTGRKAACDKHFTVVWACIYSRKFLLENGFIFKEGIIHEDTLYTPCVLYTAKTVKFNNNPVYFYRIRKGSTVNSLSEKHVHSLMTVIDGLVDFCSHKVKNEDIKAWSDNINDAVLNLMYDATLSGRELSNETSLWFEEKRFLTEFLINSKRLKTRILGLCIKILHLPMLSTYKIMNRAYLIIRS